MVTSLLIQNKSLPYPISFKGTGYSITIPARAVNFTCQIPAENALEDLRTLLNNIPSLEILIVENGEGIPIPPPVPDLPVLSYIGDYTPVVLKDENYMGVWDASSGVAPHDAPAAGWYWRVSVSGSHDLDGISDWVKDDFAKWTGMLWMKAVGLAGYQSLFESLSDGDKLGIDWVPGKYVPQNVSETDNTGQLASHLKGIDAELQKIPDVITGYTQTNAAISAAVSSAHAHANQAILDSYIDDCGALADAVAARHVHANKSLLDGYTQNNASLSDAISQMHSHSNPSALAYVSGHNTGDQDLSAYALANHGHANATQSVPGFMSAADKSRLDGIADIDPITIVAASISNGDTTHAPDGNSVFDALALKASLDSPELVTPKLGTPASGTLTNCTGYPLASPGAIGETTPNTIRGKNVEIFKTSSADGPLTSGQCCGTIVSNYGMTDADCAINLPTAAPGYAFVVILPSVRSRYFKFRAGTSDKIYLNGVAGSDNGHVGVASGYVTGTSCSFFTFKASDGGYDWFAISLFGTWVAT